PRHHADRQVLAARALLGGLRRGDPALDADQARGLSRRRGVDPRLRPRRRHGPLPQPARWRCPGPALLHPQPGHALGRDLEAPRALKITLPTLALAALALAALELFTLHALRPLEHRLLDRFVRVQAAELAGDLGIRKQPGADPQARAGLLPPLILPREHWRAGLISFTPDEDGVGRRYLLREVINGWQVPSLPARVAADLGYRVPDADDIVLAWRGAAHSFPRVSYSDLYEDFNRSRRARPA